MKKGVDKNMRKLFPSAVKAKPKMNKCMSARKAKKTMVMFTQTGAGEGSPVPPLVIKGPRVRFGQPLPFTRKPEFLKPLIAGFAQAAEAIDGVTALH